MHIMWKSLVLAENELLAVITLNWYSSYTFPTLNF